MSELITALRTYLPENCVIDYHLFEDAYQLRMMGPDWVQVVRKIDPYKLFDHRLDFLNAHLYLIERDLFNKLYCQHGNGD